MRGVTETDSSYVGPIEQVPVDEIPPPESDLGDAKPDAPLEPPAVKPRA